MIRALGLALIYWGSYLIVSKAWGQAELGVVGGGRDMYKVTSSSSMKLPLMCNQMARYSSGPWGEQLILNPECLSFSLGTIPFSVLLLNTLEQRG